MQNEVYTYFYGITIYINLISCSRFLTESVEYPQNWLLSGLKDFKTTKLTPCTKCSELLQKKLVKKIKFYGLDPLHPRSHILLTTFEVSGINKMCYLGCA